MQGCHETRGIDSRKHMRASSAESSPALVVSPKMKRPPVMNSRAIAQARNERSDCSAMLQCHTAIQYRHDRKGYAAMGDEAHPHTSTKSGRADGAPGKGAVTEYRS